MNEVAIHESVFEDGNAGVDVVAGGLADVFEHERHGFEHAVLHVHLGQTVLVHERRENGERRAGLGDNRDGDGGAESVLSLLDLQIVEQRVHHVLRTQRFRDVSERVDGCATNALLLGVEQIQQIETDSRPFFGRNELGTAIGDSTHQIHAVFLNEFVSVSQNRRETRQQIADRRVHVLHSHHIHDRFQRVENRRQHIGELFAQILIERQAKLLQLAFFAARLQRGRNAGDQIC